MRYLLLFSSLFIFLNPVFAREIAGIQAEETITLSNQQTLSLNGAGIRSKFFFKIYVGALYVTEPPLKTPQAVLADTRAKRISMHFLYDEVSKEKLNSGWHDGFMLNQDEAQLTKLKQRLERFKGLFDAVKKGDVIYLDYLPNQGTQVTINKEVNGTIPGFDFHQALMKVWLGEEPADWDLKKAMLGR